jgi:hypothetical protein
MRKFVKFANRLGSGRRKKPKIAKNAEIPKAVRIRESENREKPEIPAQPPRPPRWGYFNKYIKRLGSGTRFWAYFNIAKLYVFRFMTSPAEPGFWDFQEIPVRGPPGGPGPDLGLGTPREAESWILRSVI